MLVHWIWYTLLPNLPMRQKLTMLEHMSDPEDIYHAEDFNHITFLSEAERKALKNKDLSAAQNVVRTCMEKKIGILTYRDAGYPRRLRNIPDPPLVLYYKGHLPDFEGMPVIGVVGTRKASAYGLNSAREIAFQIANCGALVVSGGAYGIDTMAAKGALAAGRPTVVVLGCGVDVVYPKPNRGLFAQVEADGCLLSEYLPGTEPKPWQFPERNRLISGMANGVLVVEAPEVSGALITARKAFEQGREVFVIPGNIGVATCAGSNALLQECGIPVLSGWDVLKDYAPMYPDSVCRREGKFSQNMVAQAPRFPESANHSDKKDIDNRKDNAYSDLENTNYRLTQEEERIVACLSAEPIAVDHVIAQTQMPAGSVLRILTKLSLQGMVTYHPGRLVSFNKQ